MNPLFLLAYVLMTLYEYSTRISILDTIKWIKIVGAILSPDKKASTEKVRGNILKVSFMNGDVEGYYLLPYSAKPKQWTRVEAVTKQDAEDTTKVLEERDMVGSILTTEEIVIEGAPQEVNSVVVDEELESDMDEISHTKSEPKSKTKPIGELKIDKTRSAEYYKEFKRQNVTTEIELISGPGKDFFNMKITPYNINHNYHCLIFYYRKGAKSTHYSMVFTAKDYIKL